MVGRWHCPAGLLSYVQEGPFHTFRPSSNTPSHTGTQYRGTEPLGSHSAELNGSDEAVSTCTLTKSPSCCPREGQAGTSWGGHGPGGARPADVQIPRLPPPWVGNSALHWLLDDIPLTESLHAPSTLPRTPPPHLPLPPIWEMPSKTFRDFTPGTTLLWHLQQPVSRAGPSGIQMGPGLSAVEEEPRSQDC